MVEINRMVDALAFNLTGGLSNTNPDLSLGGVRSTTRSRGLGAIIRSSIPALRIDNVSPACGEGDCTIYVNADGDLVFVPPGSAEGSAVTVLAGFGAVLTGADSNKAVRVFREVGLPLTGEMQLTLVDAMNGVLAHANLTSAQRAAGRTTYRAFMLSAFGEEVRSIRLWTPPVAGAQATYSLAFEAPVAGAIQTIANETTAPTGLVWTSSTTEGSALTLATLAAGSQKGLWIRRVFPSGIVAARENVQLACKFQGA